MIRFSAEGRDGPVLGLGLSFANLDLLRLGRPIQLDVSEHALTLVIMEGDAELIARAEEALPSARIIGLTPRTIDTLRTGEVITVPRIASALPADVVLFAGETELAIIDAMKTAQLVTPTTELAGLDEYHRHEANAVEGCEECAARRPADLRQWIYSHPYSVAAIIVVLCLIAGFLLELAG